MYKNTIMTALRCFSALSYLGSYDCSWLLLVLSIVGLFASGGCRTGGMVVARLRTSFEVGTSAAGRRFATNSKKSCKFRAKSAFEPLGSLLLIGGTRKSRDPVSVSTCSSSSSNRKKSKRQHGHSSCDKSHSAMQVR